MPYEKEAVAGSIRARRAYARLTREDLAALSGVPVSTLRSYESASSVMSAESAWRIADALGCTVDDLLGRGRPEAAARKSAEDKE